MKAFTKLTLIATEHGDDNPDDFLLRTKLPKEEARMVADIIAGRREAATKIPFLAQNPDIVYPPHLNRQQCSSQATALYKATLVAPGSSLADITGGLGVDDIFFALKGAKVLHIERDTRLQEMAQWNFRHIPTAAVSSLCQDSTTWLQETHAHYDYLFADPARRDTAGRKVVSLADCTPNLLSLLPRIFQVADHLLVKASPMIDIIQACKELPHVRAVHVLAVQGECKEVLLLAEGGRHRREQHATTSEACHVPVEEPAIHCVNLSSKGRMLSHHRLTWNEEKQAEARYASSLGDFLYEPNAALMKAGAFRSICRWYPVEKLARHTHLYTSRKYLPHFPGRAFRIVCETKLSPKEIIKLLPEGTAHVMTRNYPAKAPLLQQQLKLREGGTQFLIATTLSSKKIILICRPANNEPVIRQ